MHYTYQSKYQKVQGIDFTFAEGYCVIVVTHDLAVAEKADEVLRLKYGYLI